MMHERTLKTLFMSLEDRQRYYKIPEDERPTTWLGLDPAAWIALGVLGAAAFLSYHFGG